jgi:hypothetical protein
MPDQSIIPRDIDGFNIYLSQTNDHLILGSPTNAVRFGWTSQNLSDWQDFKSDWDPLYFKYSDKKGGYTTAIKTKLEVIIAKAIIYDRENKLILKVKSTVGLTPDDCIIFKVPKSYAITSLSPHQSAMTSEPNKTTTTSERVFPQLKPVGGGLVKIDCLLWEKGSGRAHKPEGYDLIEYKVAVFYSGTSDLPTQFTDARFSLGYSSKASFMLDTNVFTSNLPATEPGAAVPLKMAVFFFRWAKSKHPNLNGPWSGPFTTPLL